jgi:uncharacterized membrane protein
MDYIKILYSCGASLLLILIIDFCWLSIMVPKFYIVHLSHIFSGGFNYAIALIFYTLYSFGITHLILLPGMHMKLSTAAVMGNGFILGLVAYGAYDLTNHATIKDWPAIVTVVDMAWGAVLTAIVSAVVYKSINMFFR